MSKLASRAAAHLHQEGASDQNHPRALEHSALDLRLNERSHSPFLCRAMAGVHGLIRAIRASKTGKKQLRPWCVGSGRGGESPPHRGADIPSQLHELCSQPHGGHASRTA